MADDATADVVTRIGVIAPQITGLDATSMQTFAQDALADAAVDGFTGTALTRAAGYLAAHYASVAFSKNNHIKTESVGALSHEYFPSANADDYLTEYLRMKTALLDQNGGASLARFM